ncbi:SGNH/GDSL hydrolase family protein [Planctomycetales bacterium ZRK34]|nr:SGNH/GDSL hydrolase family protein [Planctomycetales bacterium ZRK34]
MTESNMGSFSRRVMMRLAAGGAVAGSVNWLSTEASAAPAADNRLGEGDVVLFQGDSITDAGRSRQQTGANNLGALGHGYPMMLGTQLLGIHPYKKLQVYNRGISGHKVPDLAKRWQKDTIDLKPSLLSILIGVNDIWHKLGGRYNGTVEDYDTGFTQLLADTKAALPDVRLVVCEPFVLKTGAVNDSWFPEFDQRRAVAKKVAEAAGATWVPWQSVFDEAAKHAPDKHWLGDGVHPTTAGHALMAATWLDAVKP